MADMNLGQILHTDLTEPLDVTNKALHVSQVGSNVSITTLLNAASVADGGESAAIDINCNGEEVCMLLVSIDKQPWNLATNAPQQLSISQFQTYPCLVNMTNTPGLAAPQKAILIGIYNESDISGFIQAEELSMVWDNAEFKVQNRVGDASIATVTVKKLSIWE